MVVKTNVCYAVVATFVVQNESKASIAEALQIIKCWNEDFNPRFAMVDIDMQEINAIEEVFSGQSFILFFS